MRGTGFKCFIFVEPSPYNPTQEVKITSVNTRVLSSDFSSVDEEQLSKTNSYLLGLGENFFQISLDFQNKLLNFFSVLGLLFPNRFLLNKILDPPQLYIFTQKIA